MLKIAGQNNKPVDLPNPVTKTKLPDIDVLKTLRENP